MCSHSYNPRHAFLRSSEHTKPKKEDPGAIPDPDPQGRTPVAKVTCNMAARGSWEFPRRQIFLSSLNLYGAQNTLRVP